MRERLTLMIADRNPHIRNFLQKELSAKGYAVFTARDGRELLGLLSQNSPDLLILDLDLPHVSGVQVMDWLKGRKVRIPVIVHTFYTEFIEHPTVRDAEAFVEKTGDNVEQLKTSVDGVLRKRYPDRFACVREEESGPLQDEINVK